MELQTREVKFQRLTNGSSSEEGWALKLGASGKEDTVEGNLTILGRCNTKGRIMVEQASALLIFMQIAVEMFILFLPTSRWIVAIHLHRSLLLNCTPHFQKK